MGNDTAWSCVVDDKPAIWSSIKPWLVTAVELARIPPACIHVHHVCRLSDDVAALCRSLGVNTHPVEPFDVRYPHANKTRQCMSDFAGASRVVLTDVDVVFAMPPPLDDIQGEVAGKLVDQPNPPWHILGQVFKAAGLPVPQPCTNSYMAHGQGRVTFETIPGNFNGGLYVIRRAWLHRLGMAWDGWARWLIERIGLLDRWALHVDQVSFCLAVNELGINMSRLDDRWNYPLHLGGNPDVTDPFILHHHADFDVTGRLRTVAQVGSVVRRVNEVIAASG